MASRRSRALDAAIATSLLQSLNWMNNWAPSALARESMRLMPDIVDSASSAGRNTVRSISSGVEPVYGSETKMKGGDTSGKASSGSRTAARSEEHTSELQSLMRISYAVFCLKKKKRKKRANTNRH